MTINQLHAYRAAFRLFAFRGVRSPRSLQAAHDAGRSVPIDAHRFDAHSPTDAHTVRFGSASPALVDQIRLIWFNRFAPTLRRFYMTAI